MNKFFKTLVVSLFFTGLAHSKICTSNHFFESNNWNTHNNESFDNVSKNILANLAQNKQFFVRDIDTSFYSEELGKLVTFKSLDDIRTDRDEMFGDIVLLTLPDTGKLLEVRWYENKVKHVIYNHQLEECAADLIPYADNTLF